MMLAHIIWFSVSIMAISFGIIFLLKIIFGNKPSFVNSITYNQYTILYRIMSKNNYLCCYCCCCFRSILYEKKTKIIILSIRITRLKRKKMLVPRLIINGIKFFIQLEPLLYCLYCMHDGLYKNCMKITEPMNWYQ